VSSVSLTRLHNSQACQYDDRTRTRRHNARHHRRNRPIGNSNGFRSRNRGHIDHDQCQACHSTRGCPRAYCSTQERDRDTEEQDQACLARETTHQDNEQRQLLLVAWLSGSEIAYERDMQHEKEQTPGCSEQEQPHGRSPMGPGMMRRGS
jgi:hypothetical protein